MTGPASTLTAYGRTPMPIGVACPHCRARLTAPDKAAGHTLKCPKCKQQLAVPRPLSDTTSHGSAEIQRGGSQGDHEDRQRDVRRRRGGGEHIPLYWTLAGTVALLALAVLVAGIYVSQQTAGPQPQHPVVEAGKQVTPKGPEAQPKNTEVAREQLASAKAKLAVVDERIQRMSAIQQRLGGLGVGERQMGLAAIDEFHKGGFKNAPNELLGLARSIDPVFVGRGLARLGGRSEGTGVTEPRPRGGDAYDRELALAAVEALRKHGFENGPPEWFDLARSVDPSFVANGLETVGKRYAEDLSSRIAAMGIPATETSYKDESIMRSANLRQRLGAMNIIERENAIAALQVLHQGGFENAQRALVEAARSIDPKYVEVGLERLGKGYAEEVATRLKQFGIPPGETSYPDYLEGRTLNGERQNAARLAQEIRRRLDSGEK